jgi:crotonobetainyl-CoA:carnitine CoA-transferase CaiB-like acyl-CoA transferase
MQGVRVLDLGSMIAGPAAASTLADQGADVIKVEPTGIGDVMRYLGATRGGVSGLYHACNRGKRSIALDMKTQEGRKVVHELIDQVDVVLHNYREGVAERLGIDYETLRQHNPELIYLWVNGFGASGPMAGKPAYDSVIQAYTGVAQSQSDHKTGEPVQYYQLFSDKLTALTGAQAIAAALYARAMGKGGQYISLAMVDAVISFMWVDSAGAATFVGEDVNPGMHLSRNPVTRFSDGWITLSPLTDAQFHGCCTAFGIDSSAPELATVQDRVANPAFYRELLGRIQTAASQMTVEEGLKRLNELDVPAAPAQFLADLPADKQLRHNGTFTNTHHPHGGLMVEPVNPPNFSQTPSGAGAPSAMLGEHTDEILQSLGYTTERIATLRATGAVA